MKYFDIVGSNVVIHPDALAIPSFNKIWASADDKLEATNYIKYIVLCHHPESPYVKSMPLENRAIKLNEEIFDGNMKKTDDFVNAEAMYISFLDTLELKMLRGIRKNIEMMTESLEKRKTDSDMSFRDMKELLSLSEKADKAISSIYSLEAQVRKGEIDSSTVRGGGTIGYYEIPRNRK